MRVFVIASVLSVLVSFALCVDPVSATVPDEPWNDGMGLLDQSTRMKNVPKWVPGSGQWAKPIFSKANPALLSKRNGPESQSATPMPLPAPQSTSKFGAFQPGLKSATPMPLPGPQSSAYSTGFQQKQLKGSTKSIKTSRYHRSAR